MNEDTQHSFRLIRTSYKSADLVYEEPGRRLIVYLEMSMERGVDLCGVDTNLATWTEPAGEPIPEWKREQILERLAVWPGLRARIAFGPPADMSSYHAEMRRKGWTVEPRPDGSTLLTPPAVPLWRTIAWVTALGSLMGMGVRVDARHAFLGDIVRAVCVIGLSTTLIRAFGREKLSLRVVLMIVWFFVVCFIDSLLGVSG